MGTVAVAICRLSRVAHSLVIFISSDGGWSSSLMVFRIAARTSSLVVTSSRSVISISAVYPSLVTIDPTILSASLSQMTEFAAVAFAPLVSSTKRSPFPHRRYVSAHALKVYFGVTYRAQSVGVCPALEDLDQDGCRSLHRFPGRSGPWRVGFACRGPVVVLRFVGIFSLLLLFVGSVRWKFSFLFSWYCRLCAGGCVFLVGFLSGGCRVSLSREELQGVAHLLEGLGNF